MNCEANKLAAEPSGGKPNFLTGEPANVRGGGKPTFPTCDLANIRGGGKPTFPTCEPANAGRGQAHLPDL